MQHPVADLSQSISGPTGPDLEVLSLRTAQLLSALKSGRLTAEEYGAAVLRRLKACAHLNLTTWFSEESVLKAAQAIDRRGHEGPREGSLAGIPILIKDNIDTVGFPTSAGTPLFSHNCPMQNAPIVRRLLYQGAVVLAKTNMHELASGATSSNPHFGPVRNPWALQRIPGGSSGGSAAALSAMAGTLSLGTDTAGSVRIPAAFCGVVGMRPSSTGPSTPYAASRGVAPLALALDTIGPLGRTVEDLILLDEAVMGRTVPRRRGLAGLRLGIARQQHWIDLDPQVEAVCTKAVGAMEKAGAVLIEVDLRAIHEEASELFWILITHGNQVDLSTYLAHRMPGVGLGELIGAVQSADVRYHLDRALRAEIAESDVHAAKHGRRTALRNQYSRLLEQHALDAIAFPTVPILPPLIRPGGDRADDTIRLGERDFSAVLTMIRNTFHTCVLGAPGISLPAGLSACGLPVGIELDAAPGNDAALLSMAREVESILGPLRHP